MAAEAEARNYTVPSTTLVGGRPDSGAESFSVVYTALKRHENGFLLRMSKFFRYGIVLMIVGAVTLFLSPESQVFLVGAGPLVIGLAMLFLFLTKRPSGVVSARKFYYPVVVTNLRSQRGDKLVGVDPLGALWRYDSQSPMVDQSGLDTMSQSIPDTLTSTDDEGNSEEALRFLAKPFEMAHSVLPVGPSAAVGTAVRNAVEGMPSGGDSKIAEMGSVAAAGLSEKLVTLMSQREAIEEDRETIQERTKGIIGQLREMYSAEVDYMDGYVARFVEETQTGVTTFDSLIESFTEDIRDSLRTIERSAERDMENIEYQTEAERREIERIAASRRQAFDAEARQIQLQIKLTQAQILALQEVQQQVDKAIGSASDALKVSVEDMKKGRETLQEAEKTQADRDEGRLYLEGLKEKKKKEQPDSEPKNRDLSTQIVAAEETTKVEGVRTRATVAIEGATMRKQMAEMELRQYNILTTKIRADMRVAETYLAELRVALGEVVDGLQRMLSETIVEVEGVLNEGRRRREDIVTSRDEDLELVSRNVSRLEGAKQFSTAMIRDTQELMPSEVYRHLGPLARRVRTLVELRDSADSNMKGASDNLSSSVARIESATLSGAPPGTYYLPFWAVKFAEGKTEKTEVYGMSNLSGDGSLVPASPDLEFSAEKLADPAASAKIVWAGRGQAGEAKARGPAKSARIPFVEKQVCVRAISKIVS